MTASGDRLPDEPPPVDPFAATVPDDSSEERLPLPFGAVVPGGGPAPPGVDPLAATAIDEDSDVTARLEDQVRTFRTGPPGSGLDDQDRLATMRTGPPPNDPDPDRLATIRTGPPEGASPGAVVAGGGVVQAAAGVDPLAATARHDPWPGFTPPPPAGFDPLADTVDDERRTGPVGAKPAPVPVSPDAPTSRIAPTLRPAWGVVLVLLALAALAALAKLALRAGAPSPALPAAVHSTTTPGSPR